MLRTVKSNFYGGVLSPVAVTSAGANTTPENIGVTTAKTGTGTYTITPRIGSYENLMAFVTPHKESGTTHMAQMKSATHGVVTIETRSRAAGALSDAAFDALILKSDQWGHRWYANCVGLRSNASQRMLFFTINGTNGVLTRGTQFDGTLTKNSTGNYTITLRYPSRQIPHAFAITASKTQYCQIISKTKTEINIGVYNSSGAAANGTVYLIVLSSNASSKAWGAHQGSLKSSRGGVRAYPFEITPSVAEVASTLVIGTGDGEVTFESQLAGALGDNISITLVDPGSDGAIAVAVDGNDITVTLAYGSGAITTTATTLAAAINGDSEAAALVSATAGGTGADLITALETTNLDGGVTAVPVALARGGEMLSIVENASGDWTLSFRNKKALSPTCLATAKNADDTQPRYGIAATTTSSLQLQCTQHVATIGVLFSFEVEN